MNFPPENLQLIINCNYSYWYTVCIKNPKQPWSHTIMYIYVSQIRTFGLSFYHWKTDSVRDKKQPGQEARLANMESTPITAASADTQRISKPGQQCDAVLHHHLPLLSRLSCPWSYLFYTLWVRRLPTGICFSSCKPAPMEKHSHEAKTCSAQPAHSNPGYPEVILKDAELPFTPWGKDQDGP